EREQVCVIPVVECGGMAAGAIAYRNQHGVDEILASLHEERAQVRRAGLPQVQAVLRDGRRACAHDPLAGWSFGDGSGVFGSGGDHAFFVRERRGEARESGTVRENDIARVELTYAPTRCRRVITAVGLDPRPVGVDKEELWIFTIAQGEQRFEKNATVGEDVCRDGAGPQEGDG